MLSSETIEQLSADTIIDRVDALAPTLRARAEEAARLRRLPDATLEDAAKADIFSLLLPRSLGGAEGDLHDFVKYLRALARGDLSSAWVLGFLAAHSWLMARYPAEIQEEVFRDGARGLMAMSANPPGRAVPVDGGYEVTGQWGYCSGVMHADWVIVTAIIEGDDEVNLFLLPREDVEVLDTWYMAGLQATGSNHVKLDGRFVPARRVIGFERLLDRDNPGSSLHPGPLYGYDGRDLLVFLFPSMAVGLAEGVLADYRQRLETRRAAFSAEITGDTVTGQVRYARALSALRVAQATLDHAVELTVQTNASSPDRLSDEFRALIKLDCLSVCRMAAEAVQLAVGGSGSAIFRSADPTQRILHDLQVLMSHMTIDEDGMLSKAGEILLGRATDPDPAKNFI